MDLKQVLEKSYMLAFFKKFNQGEIKVGQFGGYVSEKACYHHGETSLYKAIIGTAQEFVGSNNVNLLLPLGQFGTRLEGGNDHASERYICTALNDITKLYFSKRRFPSFELFR